MSEPKIPGGYIILSRKIIESEIWEKPPLYLKVWLYLLARAQHSDFKKLKRGQLRTSIPEIQEACSWKVGFRKEKPSKDQIYQILDWMRKTGSRNRDEAGYESNTEAPMITTTKATHGLIITIENYEFYQNPKNYESNDENKDETDTRATREQRQPNNINKNVNNDLSNDDNNNSPEHQYFPNDYIDLVDEIEDYYQTKRLRPGWPASEADREFIRQAIREGFTRDEMIQGINLAFLQADEVNSFEYCLKVMRTERKKLEKSKSKKVIPMKRSNNNTNYRSVPEKSLPKVMQPDFQPSEPTRSVSVEEVKEKIKLLTQG